MSQEKKHPEQPHATPSSKTQRPWREIAAAVLRETDNGKILELARQLCDAVDEQVLKRAEEKKQ